MSTGNVSTRVGSSTYVANTPDIGNVVIQWSQELRSVIRRSGVEFKHDLSLIEEQIGVMAIYNLISQISLVFSVGDTFIRSYDYDIAARELTQSGPSADDTPVARSFPDGAVVTVCVCPRPGKRDDPIYKRLGWSTARPLKGKRQTRSNGTFVSGNYGWERTISVNPDVDSGDR